MPPRCPTQSVNAIRTLFARVPMRQFSLTAVNRQQIAEIYRAIFSACCGARGGDHKRRDHNEGRPPCSRKDATASRPADMKPSVRQDDRRAR
jgi:hypothetical protein